MRVDHIGYAVKNIDKAIQTMEHLGYTFTPKVDDKDRNVSIAFGELDGYRIELVAPMSKGSPIDIQLSKVGPTPYHICYKSNAIEEDIEMLKAGRFRVTIPLSPAIAFNNRRVVFLYSLSVGLIEIVEDGK